MRLKRLYIHGFKSFADKVEITFEHGVTGVVGPNGCGKSNIADAIRWVLGEQSAKQLRGSKMEDVIFNGTDKRRRLGYCEVSLTFENEDRALPIDYTEVSVTRRVYRTGDGEYMLNGQQCRLKDIVDLFRDTGTGRDGYSIIGQGRVDEILSQKTEERRQVFEEAAGIVKYKTRKQEAERRLENTAANLARVSDIVENLEERLEPLRLQSEDARKYLALRDELKDLELNAFLLRSERYQQRIEEIRETLDAISGEIASCDEERSSCAVQRDSEQEKLTKGENESALLRDALQEMIREVEAGEGSAGVLRERLQAYEKERQRLLTEKQAALEGESGIDRRIEELSLQYKTSLEALAGQKEHAQKRDSELEAAEQALKQLEDSAEQAKEDVIAAMNRLGDVRSEQARLLALSQAIDGQIKNLASQLEAGEGAKQELTRALTDAEGQHKEETSRLEALENDTREVSERTRKAGEEYDEISRQTNSLLAERQEVNTRARLLAEMQRDYEGYNQSVRRVLKEAERLGGAGVHGVVANVIRADKRIEKAVEVALGSALQDIIVDAEDDARAMIDFLKENNFGRATFLPISTMRGRTLDAGERRVLSMPGCVGVASEMVAFDPKYRGIIENLLGRTVIAEDLKSGIPIHRAGRQAFRLVTLDGSVMNVGGSMTGGSLVNRVTSILSRERELKEANEALAELNKRIAAHQDKLRRLAEERAHLKSDRQEAFDAFHQQQIAVTRAEAHLSQAQEALSLHQGRMDAIQREQENLRETKLDISRQEEQLLSQKQQDENASGEMREKAARLQSELNAARPRVDALRQAVSDERVLLASAEKDAQMQKNEMDRLSSQKGDTARMLREAENGLSALKEKADADEALLKEAETKLGVARASLEDTRSRFQAADGERLKAQEALRTVNEKLETLNRQAEELTERQHRADMLMQRVQSDLDNLTGRIFEDYQLTKEGAEPFRREDFKLSEGEKRINAIKTEIKSLGSVNVSAMDEYREVSARYEELSAQKDDLERARDDLLGIIDELAGKMEKQFKSQFEQLDAYFSETFTELFGGGHAHLSLEDPSNALSSGIEIVAQPPGKKLQLLSLLSGGERALTAIAILFAMLKLKPTPFCMLDEIEAALDDANIDNFADYLKTYSENTQFVVVTHRKGTMARCDALYGVAMEEKGVSKLMSVKLQDAPV
ncbi:MAG: chromosome segregation protein SMC [Clostridia bacterium]|nr:chromosome segregation protein SMC [Clostridia bacterium]